MTDTIDTESLEAELTDRDDVESVEVEETDDGTVVAVTTTYDSNREMIDADADAVDSIYGIMDDHGIAPPEEDPEYGVVHDVEADEVVVENILRE